jgi:hypothetical protein
MTAPVLVSTPATRSEVRLHLDSLLPMVLGMVADRYGDDPETVGTLLLDLAITRGHLANAQQQAERRDGPDFVTESAGGAVDAALDELVEAAVTEYVTVDLPYRAALELADRITAAAGETVTGQARARRAA